MERRQFLKSAVICGTVGLAGCAGSPADPVWSVRQDPQPPGLRYTVEVVTVPTSTAPLTLQITIANPDEILPVYFGDRRSAFFEWALVDAPFVTYDTAYNGSWHPLRYDVDQEAWQLPDLGLVQTDEYRYGELGPGDAQTEQVALVNGSSADPLVSVATRETIAVRTSFEILPDWPDYGTKVTWGFEVISPTG